MKNPWHWDFDIGYSIYTYIYIYIYYIQYIYIHISGWSNDGEARHKNSGLAFIGQDQHPSTGWGRSRHQWLQPGSVLRPALKLQATGDAATQVGNHHLSLVRFWMIFKKNQQPLLVNISDFLGLGKPMETHMAGKLAISNFAHNHVCWFYPHFKAMKSQSFYKFSYQFPLTKNGLRSFNHV